VKSLFFAEEAFFMLYYSVMIRLTFGLGVAMLLSGCQTVFQSLYGIHNLRQLSAAELRHTASQYGIAPPQLAVLDTSYRAFLVRARALDTAAIKNHYQPLQASYYDAAGRLQELYVNCYAGGFPNLNWQAQGGFNQFPPRPQAPADTLLPLAAYLPYLRTPDGQPFPPLPAADYTVVVQWSRFMGRQSRRLIELVQRNALLAQQRGQSVQLLFVSNDNLQAYLAAKAQRQSTH
jgi:hypothetical protein